MKRLIICGPRDFPETEAGYNFVDKVIAREVPFTIFRVLSGTQSGIDSLGEDYAGNNFLPMTPYEPDWDEHGNAAGPIRNSEMVKDATHCLAFQPMGKRTRGTGDTISKAINKGIPLKVIEYSADLKRYKWSTWNVEGWKRK